MMSSVFIGMKLKLSNYGLPIVLVQIDHTHHAFAGMYTYGPDLQAHHYWLIATDFATCHYLGKEHLSRFLIMLRQV